MKWAVIHVNMSALMGARLGTLKVGERGPLTCLGGDQGKASYGRTTSWAHQPGDS